MRISAIASLLVAVLFSAQFAQATSLKGLKPDALLTVDLFDEPRPTLSGCDQFTNLELREGFGGLVAIFGNGVKGDCEIYVPRKIRAYGMRRIADSCGSKVYVNEDQTVSILDHSTRLCKDLKPAQIEVFEHGVKYYGNTRNVPAPQMKVLYGYIESVMAIGGETTGWALISANEFKPSRTEIDLETNNLVQRAQEIDGYVQVNGYFKNVRGVEIPLRTVFVVTDIRPGFRLH